MSSSASYFPPQANVGGTDDQNLSLSGESLSIEDGNTVDLSALNDAEDIFGNPVPEL